jgi:DNA repair exonuclease SbcCD ATPase subunit
MYINSIELKNYERMSLNNINRFYYKPTKSETIIGGNGSGKTSLLERLSPYIEKKDFTNGGSCSLSITHRGSQYNISITNGKFSFLKDDVELNNGGTMSVQDKLIVEHIGLTKMMNDVFLNKKSFVTMSVKDRKEWLTLISPSNYTYVLQVYQNARNKLRDKQGLKREYASRLKKIEENIKTEDEYVRLKEYIVGIRDTIDILHTKKENVTPVNDVVQDATALTDTLLQLINKKQYYIHPTLLGQKLTTINKDIRLTEESISKLEEGSLSSTVELEKALRDVTDSINHKNTLGLEIDSVCNIHKFLYVNCDEIREAMSEYFNKKTEFTQGELDLLISNINKKTDILKSITNELHKVTIELDTLREKKENSNVTCPKCTHTFKDGYDEHKEKSLRDTFIKYTDRKSVLEKELIELTNRRDEIVSYVLARDTLKDIIHKSDDIRGFITREYYDEMSMLLGHQNVISELCELINQRDNILKELEIAKCVDDELKIKMREELTKLNILLSSLYRKRTLTTRNIKFAQSQLDLENRILTMKRELDEYQKEFEAFSDYANKSLLNSYYDKIIKLLKDELNTKEEQLRKLENDFTIYKGMKSEIVNVNEDIVLLTDIERALSPNKGLIAKSIIGFLNVFIDHVNTIIETTWSYDMRVMVPAVTESDLDYKFPVYVEGKIREDISKTSTGMRTIINLAFKLASMSFLKMNDFPIYLDEFGSSFDTEHRRKTIELIKNIQDNYPQVFIISHYDDVLYSLDNNVINLSSNNVETNENKKYNSNVEIS